MCYNNGKRPCRIQGCGRKLFEEKVYNNISRNITCFFVISYLLPQRIGGTDYTGVYTDAGLYGTQENVEVKKTGNIYTLRIKPLTDDDEYVNVEFSPDRPGEMIQIDDYSRCRVYMFNNSMCIQNYKRYIGDYTNGELENSYSSGEYELYSLAYMVKPILQTGRIITI